MHYFMTNSLDSPSGTLVLCAMRLNKIRLKKIYHNVILLCSNLTLTIIKIN